jgi:hypothetical protein
LREASVVAQDACLHKAEGELGQENEPVLLKQAAHYPLENSPSKRGLQRLDSLSFFGVAGGCLERLEEEEREAVRQEALANRPAQVSPLEFVTMTLEKEHLIGNPMIWAEWPNKENT